MTVKFGFNKESHVIANNGKKSEDRPLAQCTESRRTESNEDFDNRVTLHIIQNSVIKYVVRWYGDTLGKDAKEPPLHLSNPVAARC